MEICPLRRGDIPSALSLSIGVGWNHLATDWKRLLELAPNRCFVGCVGDEVIATATAVGFDDRVGWIGMMIVDQDHHGKRFGTKMFHHGLRAAQTDGLVIGLDATEQGVPLYRKEGFVESSTITRWFGNPTGSDSTVRPFECLLDSVRHFDETVTGVDRSRLLARLLEESTTVGLLRQPGNEAEGYAILRPGREHWQLGPVVAKDSRTVASLLAGTAERIDGSVVLDALRPDAGNVVWVNGFDVQYRLTRMTFGEPSELLSGDHVFAAAGLELG